MIVNHTITTLQWDNSLSRMTQADILMADKEEHQKRISYTNLDQVYSWTGIFIEWISAFITKKKLSKTTLLTVIITPLRFSQISFPKSHRNNQLLLKWKKRTSTSNKETPNKIILFALNLPLLHHSALQEELHNIRTLILFFMEKIIDLRDRYQEKEKKKHLINYQIQVQKILK